MFFHASQAQGIQVLAPHASNHGMPLVYLSAKRENTLVYLSNAVEKYCREIGFPHEGTYHKWASYGFTPQGVLRLEEYYPDAVGETYQGVSGYIYQAENVPGCKEQSDIPYAFITAYPVPVDGCVFIPDAYEAIMEAVAKGQICLSGYEENTAAKRDWIHRTVLSEYKKAADHPEYRAFLEGKFGFLFG